MQNDKEQFKKEFIKRLIRFTVNIVRLCEMIRKHHPYLMRIIDQLIGSAGSVGANVVEAKSSSSRREYKKYFEIALKSSNETIYWLMVLFEVIKQSDMREEIEKYKQEAIEISKILGASVITLKDKRN